MKPRIFSASALALWKTIGAFLFLACAGADIGHAQTPAAAPTASSVQSAVPAKPAAKSTSIAPKSSAKPYWNELTPAQREALAPLAIEWNKLGNFNKEKWLELSKKFASMSPTEQARMQERMRDWVKLTPEQRRAARENYARVKKLTPEQRAEQWQRYQQLSEEKKKQLAATAPAKKPIVNPPLVYGNKPPQAKTPVPAKQPLPKPEGIQPSATAPSTAIAKP